ILTYIDRWKRPILVAGDTPDSDGYMLFNGTAENGVHLWVNRKAKYMEQINGMIKQHSAAQAGLGLGGGMLLDHAVDLLHVLGLAVDPQVHAGFRGAV
ncbi:hypothetical protein ACV34T_32355, partial [Pseudomonas aeruginosa]